METRHFKTRNGTDLAFSVVGQGMGPIGDFYELLDEKMTITTVEQAYQAGIRLFDTSPHYGNGLSESRLGAGLRRIPRDEIVVSTKIGRVMDPFHKPAPRNPDAYSPGFAGGFPHAPHFDYSYDGTMRSVEQSLLRTGLSRFDILLIHDCDVWTHGKEADQRFKEAMEGAYRALRQAAKRKDRRRDWLRHQRGRHLREIRAGWRFRCRDDGRPLFAADPERPRGVPAAGARKENGRDVGGRVQFRNSGDRCYSWREVRICAGAARKSWTECARSKPSAPLTERRFAVRPCSSRWRTRPSWRSCWARSGPRRRGQCGRRRQQGFGGPLERPEIGGSARFGGADAWRVRVCRTSITNCRKASGTLPAFALRDQFLVEATATRCAEPMST